MTNRIIIIGVDQGVMIGGRFDGWLAQLTEAGWVTIRKLDEAEPYAALPDVLRSPQSLELGVAGPATGPRNDQALHDAEARRRALLSNFPTVNVDRLFGNVLAQPASEARALAAEAERDALREALAPFGSGAVVFYENEPDDCVLSLGRWKYQEDGRARFYADVQFTVADVRRARALTEASE